MSFRPAHRRRRDPYARQILGVYKPPMPDCAVPGCGHPWRKHVPRDPSPRGQCNEASCDCLRYRGGEQR